MSEGFLKRWATRKTKVAEQATAPIEQTDKLQNRPVTIKVTTATEDAAVSAELQSTSPPPLPTLDDVRELTCSSDFLPFMREGVAPATRNAALKTLFTDPQFNVMDMMDIYVDDYSKPDPMTPAFLKLLNQAADLGLFAEQPEALVENPSIDTEADAGLVKGDE
jgi:Protein of unknown function (DUF3306)